MRIGVDLGGTKTEACVLAAGNQLLWRKRLPTPGHSVSGILNTIVELVAQAADACQLPADLPVGIGTPGSISPTTGLLRGSNTVVLNGQPLKPLLERQLQRPVAIANDANCFALAEACAGAACEADSVFGVILGTGCGGGLVWRQQLINGAQGIGGEWGHNRLAHPLLSAREPRRCFCGQSNCNETWLAGPALTRSFQQAGVGCDALPQAIAQLPENTAAQAVWRDYIELLAFGLAQVVNVFDPETIVLGGGVSNIAGLAEAVLEVLPNYVFSDCCQTRVVSAALGDSAGVIGAAWLNPAT